MLGYTLFLFRVGPFQEEGILNTCLKNSLSLSLCYTSPWPLAYYDTGRTLWRNRPSPSQLLSEPWPEGCSPEEMETSRVPQELFYPTDWMFLLSCTFLCDSYSVKKTQALSERCEGAAVCKRPLPSHSNTIWKREAARRTLKLSGEQMFRMPTCT